MLITLNYYKFTHDLILYFITSYIRWDLLNHSLVTYTSFSGLFPLLTRGTLPLVTVEEISQTIDSENLTVQNSVQFAGPLATTSISTNAKFDVRSPKRVQLRKPPFSPSSLPAPPLILFATPDSSASDGGAQDNGAADIPPPPMPSQMAVATVAAVAAPSIASGSTNRSSSMKWKLGLLSGRNLAACTLRRWSSGNSNARGS
ncbi:plastid-lipid-associated protein, chloroplastic [Fagus crenata]